MAYSGSIYFNTSVLAEPFTAEDKIEFRLISSYLPASKNYTASLSVGSLNINLQPTTFGQLPFATSSFSAGNFIFDMGNNYIQLSSNISAFYHNYQQVPSFLSGSTNPIAVSSSLYNAYGDISYPFKIEYADKIVLIGLDGRYQILSVLSTEFVSTNLQINVDPSINVTWVQNTNLVATMLVLKKLKDEQNILLSFKKPDGDTSYGFIIPEDIALDIVNNISSIQSNVQNQLLSTQENSG